MCYSRTYTNATTERIGLLPQLDRLGKKINLLCLLFLDRVRKRLLHLAWLAFSMRHYILLLGTTPPKNREVPKLIPLLVPTILFSCLERSSVFFLLPEYSIFLLCPTIFPVFYQCSELHVKDGEEIICLIFRFLGCGLLSSGLFRQSSDDAAVEVGYKIMNYVSGGPS